MQVVESECASFEGLEVHLIYFQAFVSLESRLKNIYVSNLLS